MSETIMFIHGAWLESNDRHSSATTEFVEFRGRSHLLMAGEGWEEVAQYIADWLDRVLRPAPVAADRPGV